MNKVLHFIALTLLLFGNLTAGESLSLQDALTRARKYNYDLKLAESEKDEAQANTNSTLSVFLPRISIASSYTATTDPLNVFGLKLKQGSVTTSDFNPVLLNDPGRFYQYTTKVEVQQPLINLDGFSGRSAAQDALSAMEQKEIRTGQYLEFRVKAAYFELVLARKSLDVVDVALKAALSNSEQAKHYLDQGMINRAEYLQSQVRLLSVETKKVEIENTIRNAGHALQLLLGQEDDAGITPTDTLSVPPLPANLADIDAINSTRSDMLAMKYGVDAAEGMVRMNYFKLLPTLNAFGSYEWNDQRIFGKKGTSWMVGAMLKWDIFPGFGQISEIQKAEAKLKRAETEFSRQRLQNRNDLENTVMSLESNTRRLKLSEEAVRQAEEHYRILSERYAGGIGNTTDLLNAEASLAGVRLEYLQTLYALNMSVFMMELLSVQ